MIDVLIAGAGPAGSVAAILLARAGARVLLVDRDTFPRDKICGDTLSPGAVGLLARLGVSGGVLDRALALRGMRVTGPGTSVTTRYAEDSSGLALRRLDLDGWLLAEAVRAGAHIEESVRVERPLLDETGSRVVVRGAVLRRQSDAHDLRMPAIMTIAADGRRSVLARSLGLAAYPPRPRRWAFAAYASGVSDVGDVGEMHIRPRRYLGVAPLPGGLVNVCLVTTPTEPMGKPIVILRQAIDAEPELAARFARAEFEGDARVLGPLAVDARAPGTAGLLLAGDAAGFVDPMTGDGLYLAMLGATLAAEEVKRVLETGELGMAPHRLAAARHAALGTKTRFNRVVRRLVDTPLGLGLASRGAAWFPGVVRQAVRYAGGAR